MTSASGSSRVPRPIATAALVWLATVAVDFGLHAGLLAPIYDWTSPFLLEPLEAFGRIPAAYASFLGIAAALVWLLPRLGVHDARRGAAVAGALGAVMWAIVLLSLWSISTADPALLGAWWLGQVAEMTMAGAVIGAAISGVSVRRLLAAVIAVILATAVSAVALQSIGYATAPVVGG